jgi:hypothetical protein
MSNISTVPVVPRGTGLDMEKAPVVGLGHAERTPLLTTEPCPEATPAVLVSRTSMKAAFIDSLSLCQAQMKPVPARHRCAAKGP